MPFTSSGGLRGPLTLKPSGAETTSTTSGSREVFGTNGMTLLVDITAASGTTPTMTVVIEGSSDLVNWITLATVGLSGYSVGSAAAAPTNFTGISSARAVVPNTQYVRSRSVIAGTTPSFTYSVTGDAG